MSVPRKIIQGLLEKNGEYAKTFPGTMKMEQMREGRENDENRHIVLTCLDPRCVPEQYFGPGFRGAVFRNAGGRATDDVVRSLTDLRALVNMKTVLVVHHTDCGVTHLTDEEIRQFAISKNPDAAADVNKMDFGLWKEEQLEEVIREDVRKLRAEKSLKGMEVYGFALETFTGVVTEVEV